LNAKSLIRGAIHRFGGLAAARLATRNGLRIAGYHHFPLALRPALERQCDWIRRHYRPVSMREVAESLDSGNSLPPDSLAVTVDDGYLDFFTVGYPVFRAHGIPATVYLATDFLDHRAWFWWHRILYAFLHSSHSSVRCPILGYPLLLKSESARREGASQIIERAKSLPESERLALCNEIHDRLDVPLPPEPPTEWSPMSWNQVRELCQQGVEFGAHTKTHTILSTVAGPERLQEEIFFPKRRIEEETGNPVLHFAYPNGKWRDIDDHATAAVREAGYRTAVTFQSGFNRPPDRFLLRRLGVAPGQDQPLFEEIVSGIRHLLDP
jgi:peptidoglycan/xylan/chitin deacetylase (PgdA/CDA1 family)